MAMITSKELEHIACSSKIYSINVQEALDDVLHKEPSKMDPEATARNTSALAMLVPEAQAVVTTFASIFDPPTDLPRKDLKISRLFLKMAVFLQKYQV